MTQPDLAPDDGVRSRQQQIASNLRALILSGDLRPGDRVPSTSALMEQYGVTNPTVQRALAILKDEGFLKGDKGKGVFVTANQPVVIRASHYPRPAPEGQPYPWISTHSTPNRPARIDLISVDEVPAPAQVAAAFGAENGASVLCRHQLLHLGDEPAELLWSYYPVEIARGTRLAERRKIKGGTPAVLAELGYPLRNAIDQVGTRLATVDEFIALKLPQDMPVLRQIRVLYTDNQRPVQVDIMIKAGQQYEIQYELPE
ncbi:GntR family transcriptional regulator [Actinoplanes sp. NPDC026670]|uniref:GntR family transcriptional regulator n=1 Tax=Actinoplanes sp. NPDC026670 TaxID=3154700 RepID=UPI00340C4D7A